MFQSCIETATLCLVVLYHKETKMSMYKYQFSDNCFALRFVHIADNRPTRAALKAGQPAFFMQKGKRP